MWTHKWTENWRMFLLLQKWAGVAAGFWIRVKLTSIRIQPHKIHQYFYIFNIKIDIIEVLLLIIRIPDAIKKRIWIWPKLPDPDPKPSVPGSKNGKKKQGKTTRKRLIDYLQIYQNSPNSRLTTWEKNWKQIFIHTRLLSKKSHTF